MSEAVFNQEGITAEQLFRHVRILANQCPVRYYLAGVGGEYKTVAIELYLEDTRHPWGLTEEFKRDGLIYQGITKRGELNCFRWEGPRKWEGGRAK